MNIRFLSIFLLGTLAFAQNPSAPDATKPPVTPPTAQAATPPAAPVEIPPETVVATVNEKKVTAGDMNRMLQGLPPQTRQAAVQDPQAFLERYALFQKLAETAEKAKLDEVSPYKEQIADARRQVLVNAQVNEKTTSIMVLPEEQKKHYEANKEKYRESSIKMIYIPFSVGVTPPVDPKLNPKAKKILSEAEAKTKADDLVKQARAGTDFVKLVKENSEDPGSAAKDGDLGMVIRNNTANLPEPLKLSLLALKEGEISEPVRQPNGFYVFKAYKVNTPPYGQVRDEIFKELKDAGLRSWLDETKKQATAKIENAAYFARPLAPATQP